MVTTFGVHLYFERVIFNLVNFMDSSKGQMSEYNNDQNQVESKDYLKDKFNICHVWIKKFTQIFAT
jgi:hypothetical protein